MTMRRWGICLRRIHGGAAWSTSTFSGAKRPLAAPVVQHGGGADDEAGRAFGLALPSQPIQIIAGPCRAYAIHENAPSRIWVR